MWQRSGMQSSLNTPWLVEQNSSWEECITMTTLRVASNQTPSQCPPVTPQNTHRYLSKWRVGYRAEHLMSMSNVKWQCGEQGWCICGVLAAHQCDLGSNHSIEATCGLSLLLVLSLATRGFSLGTPVFPSPQKPIVSNSNSIWKTWIPLNEFIKTPKCYVGKQITIYKWML